MKKGSKAKKIIIAILAIVIIIAIVIGILLATGVLDVNLSKKSKMAAGVEKLGESFTEPFDNLNELSEKNGNEIKVLNNINEDSATEVSTEISANIEELDIPELSSSDKSTVKDVTDLVNKSNVGLAIRYDGNQSAYVNAKAKLDKAELSAEVVYDGSQLGVRSEEINSKWLTLQNDDLTDLLEENGIELNDIKDITNTSSESADKLIEALDIDEKTRDEIIERYSDVLKDFIDDKSKDIESEKTKVDVDGKEKSCKKLTLKLDDGDVKDLLKKYVNTFKDDSQVKEILTNTMNALGDMLAESGESDVAEEMTTVVDELYGSIDDINSEIDELEFNGSLKIVVYATNTKVYRTDIIVEIEDTTVNIETTFNKETTEMNIGAKSSGVSLDIVKIILTNKDNGVNLKIEPSKTITEKLGTDFSCELDYTTESSKSEIKVSADIGEYGSGTVAIKTDIAKNEEKAYEDTTTISCDINAPDYIVVKGSVALKSSIKTGDVSIPTISNSESVDMTDETKLEEYVTDSKDNIVSLLNSLKDIDILEDVVEELEYELGL